ncbi:arginine N-succinyltransferase [Nitrosomonas europaea]|uniref:arginine N-succinyltransferase n=1 Tax=Nitrosomonas europaea TaxID=915 RepID=UPI00326313FF
MNSTGNTSNNARLHWSHVLLIVLATIVLTVAGTYWVLTTYVFVSSFEPVVLSTKEEKTLEQKLRTIGYDFSFSSPTAKRNDDLKGEIDEEGFLKPEVYSEQGAKREVSFTEREVNALLAKNTDLAQKLAIDFADELVSARLLLPLEEDFPVLGGKTLRLNAGLGMAYRNDKPVIILKGVSIMGVPVPNAWLGGLKNIDLVSEFGMDPGFWKSFSEGVEHIQVTDGKIDIRLKE